MALDTFGNYIADIWPVPVSPLPTSVFGSSGVGAPNNADGNNGDTYVNLTTGDLYTKAGGVWILQQGVAGGSGESGVGSPEGVVTASVGTTYVDLNFPYPFWVKTSGAGNTGWTALIQ